MLRLPLRHIYPLLVAAFPVLFTWSHNSDMLTIGDMLPVGLFIIVVFGLILRSLRKVLRDPERAALITSLIAFWCFSYGIASALCEAVNGGPFESRRAGGVLAAATLILLVFAIRWAVRSRRGLAPLNHYLGVVALLLVGLNVAEMAWARRSVLLGSPAAVPAGAGEGAIPSAAGSRAEGAPKGASFPNIIWLMTDGYGRADVLQKIYGFDNTPFLKALADEGFYIAGNARSNYSLTILSLASAFNVQLLSDLARRYEGRQTDTGPIVDLLKNNLTMDLLRRAGYDIVTFASGYNLAEIRQGTQFIEAVKGRSEFVRILLEHSPIIPLFQLYDPELAVNPADAHRARTNAVFDLLPATLRREAPVFVFAHVLLPHPPFLFDADGAPLPAPHGVYTIRDGNFIIPWLLDKEQYRRGYVGQVRYLNKRILELIPRIKRESSRPLVVLISGDHGPGSNLVLNEQASSDMFERFSILAAVLLPERDYSAWYPSVSPVNFFVLILNKYLGTNFPQQKDLSFFAAFEDHFDFTPVDPESLKP